MESQAELLAFVKKEKEKLDQIMQRTARSLRRTEESFVQMAKKLKR